MTACSTEPRRKEHFQFKISDSDRKERCNVHIAVVGDREEVGHSHRIVEEEVHSFVEVVDRIVAALGQDSMT